MEKVERFLFKLWNTWNKEKVQYKGVQSLSCSSPVKLKFWMCTWNLNLNFPNSPHEKKIQQSTTDQNRQPHHEVPASAAVVVVNRVQVPGRTSYVQEIWRWCGWRRAVGCRWLLLGRWWRRRRWWRWRALVAWVLAGRASATLDFPTRRSRRGAFIQLSWIGATNRSCNCSKHKNHCYYLKRFEHAASCRHIQMGRRKMDLRVDLVMWGGLFEFLGRVTLKWEKRSTGRWRKGVQSFFLTL